MPTINLLSSGVMLADPLMGSTSFMGKIGLFKPVSQLAGWLAGGSGQLLPNGLVMAEGLDMAGGLVMAEGKTAAESVKPLLGE